MNLQIKFGRTNTAVTVYFPEDCPNSCPFCTSKASYGEKRPNVDKVLDRLKKWSNTQLPDVVITGGEPSANVALLKRIVDVIPTNKNVYINTTFLESTKTEFIEYVNTEPKIKAVNISRHSPNYHLDSLILHGVAQDKDIAKIIKPVKINVVAPFSMAIVKRWFSLGKNNLRISFRQNYNQGVLENLHHPYDETSIAMAQNLRYVGHSQCHVCDTTLFEYQGLSVDYHRGLPLTSLKTTDSTTHRTVLEINDVVIFQDGSSGYDWDGRRVLDNLGDAIPYIFRIARIPHCCDTTGHSIIRKRAAHIGNVLNPPTAGDSYCGFTGACGFLHC